MLDNQINELNENLEVNHIDNFCQERIQESAYLTEDEILVTLSVEKKVIYKIRFWQMQKLNVVLDTKKKDWFEFEDTLENYGKETWHIQISQKEKKLIAMSSESRIRVYDIKKETITKPRVCDKGYLFDYLEGNHYCKHDSFVLQFHILSYHGKETMITNIGKYFMKDKQIITCEQNNNLMEGGPMLKKSWTTKEFFKEEQRSMFIRT